DKTSKSEPDIYNQNETYERKVIFQEMWNDYLIFYDAQKNIYYLKYRKDKWDYANDELANQFVQGIEYIISFQFIKTIHNAHELLNMPDSSRDLPDGEEARKIRDKKVFVVGVYKLHKQSMNIRF
ncbi:MAG: hypothetical protein OEV66_12525, partial [Spirochaetia bacterium]|nr:hypothetical protein [Spirochaetia bacterium]